jgi:hypothetical protein
MEDVCTYTLWPFFLFYGHLAYFPPFRYIFPRFGILHPEISGNPGGEMLFVNESTNERERERKFFSGENSRKLKS